MPYGYARFRQPYNQRQYAPSNRDAWKSRPATAAQIAFVQRLQGDKVCTPFTATELGQMTGGIVSELIDQLKTAPRRPEPVSPDAPRLSFAPMIAMFNQAATHLKWPKVRLQTSDGYIIILSLAGSRSRNAGCIYVKGEGGYGEAPYYGKINPDGSFDIRNAPATTVPLLTRFSADPAGVAAEYGRLTGNCCFCHRELTDERSTSVGYGPICANHYGLPWGSAGVAEEAAMA